MREDVVGLLRCVECEADALDLRVLASAGEEVETAYLFCPGCARFYFVLDGIARLLGDELAELLDLRLVHEKREAFAEHERELGAFLDRLESGPRRSATWNIEDAAHWDTYFGDPDEQARLFEFDSAFVAGTPDRRLLRERHLFARVRPRVRGETLIDLGCGRAADIRALLDPTEHGYRYVGTDLSLEALRLARERVRGDFVQCSIERPPFRDGSAGVVIALGSLHHLEHPDVALDAACRIVRPGGLIAFHEVTLRRRPPAGTNVHNDAIDLTAALAVLRRYGDVQHVIEEHSPLRALLSIPLRPAMRRSAMITRLLLAADGAFLRTIGRAGRALGPRGAIVVAVKAPVSAGSGGDR